MPDSTPDPDTVEDGLEASPDGPPAVVVEGPDEPDLAPASDDHGRPSGVDRTAAWLRREAEALADPARPLPGSVQIALAVIGAGVLLLTLRLIAVRLPQRPATAEDQRTPLASATPTPAPAADPAAPADLEATIEGWRAAWQARDIARYASFYSETFGAQGKDLGQWREHKAKVFATGADISVGVEKLELRTAGSIAIAEFVQVYRAGSYLDRGTKRLYLRQENGAWRIFNEEWEPIE